MSPRLVLKVASQTDVAGMHGGGAALNNTTRLVDPVAGGHVGARAVVVNGWVVGVGNVLVVVVARVVVVVVVGVADFDPLFTRNTMPTIAAATIASPMPRRVLRRRLRFF
jgi:hypothetical protein